MAGIGLKRFFLAKYNYNDATGDVSYSDGKVFLKAVSLNPEINTQDNGNDLYADDHIVESVVGKFIDGSLELETDNLTKEANALITGITPEIIEINGKQISVLRSGNNMQPPYLGLGTIRTAIVNGVEKFQAYVFTKVKFGIDTEEFTTKGQELEWQTPTITASVYQDDTSNENFRIKSYCDTFEEAVDVIKYFLNIEDESIPPVIEDQEVAEDQTEIDIIGTDISENITGVTLAGATIDSFDVTSSTTLKLTLDSALGLDFTGILTISGSWGADVTATITTATTVG